MQKSWQVCENYCKNKTKENNKIRHSRSCLPDKNWSEINSSLIIMSFWRSKLNEEIIKKAKDGYVNACSFPVITDARFLKNGIVNSTWSQKSPELGKKRQFAKLFSLSPPASLTSFPLRYVSVPT